MIREWGSSEERTRRVEDALDGVARDVTRLQEEQEFLSRLVTQAKQAQLGDGGHDDPSPG